MCVMIGWGLIYGRQEHPHLMQAHIKKISVSECKNRVRPVGATITRNHICVFEDTDDPHESSTICDGDSGGPLMCGKNLEFVAGVVSWTDHSCSGKIPAVYTRVSQYLKWIAKTVPSSKDFVYTPQMEDVIDSFIKLIRH
ncbi:unnamed protein product [Lymnaea stagnalis]|uniref:Peptidase S1 domain-containing protein n=1 Tax=Lymnaea stagnalis TaxID=6523 RepID=A0AAV2HI54_LYMST